ncbi:MULTISPECIES: AbrB/MazE/SpoVT family DNA-binding domain-containing protein [Pseudomonas]
MEASPSAKKEPPLMNESVRTIVQCQDPGDGSGDVIIDLPDDILEHMGLKIGDSLSIELIGGSIVLKPIRDADAQP